MKILSVLENRWKNLNHPFLIHDDSNLYFRNISKQKLFDLSMIECGDVVALIGDFNPKTILTFLRLIEKKAVIVPLTNDTKSQHEYFFESALVDYIINENRVVKLNNKKNHKYLDFFEIKKTWWTYPFFNRHNRPPKSYSS